jgi:hypothetical protein
MSAWTEAVGRSEARNPARLGIDQTCARAVANRRLLVLGRSTGDQLRQVIYRVPQPTGESGAVYELVYGTLAGECSSQRVPMNVHADPVIRGHCRCGIVVFRSDTLRCTQSFQRQSHLQPTEARRQVDTAPHVDR